MTNTRTPTRLDPRKPLVLDTRELGRRAGSMLRRRFTVPAPESLRLELIGVPVGSDLELDVRLESVVEGVLVTGQASALAVGECGRCLEPVTAPLEVDVQELYVYPAQDRHRAHETTEDDEEFGRLEGDYIDLEPAVRDAVVLALPMSPVCRDDCEGLCAECGRPFAELPADHEHEHVDPRWAALVQAQESMTTDSTTTDEDQET